MKSICGADCDKCLMKNSCKGCFVTGGCPFGKKCFIAEYIEVGGMNNFSALKRALIDEFNALNIEGMPVVTELYALNGATVNLAYPLPSGESIRFLDDDSVYLGAQVENEFCDDDNKKCFGLIAGVNFLLVAEYNGGGTGAEIVLFKRR